MIALSRPSQSVPGLLPIATRLLFGGSLVAMIALLFGAGCSPSVVSDVEPTIRFSTDSLATYFLEGTVIPGSDSLGDPHDMAVAGGYLLFADDFTTHPIQIIDMVTGEWVAAAGGPGEGPGEGDVSSLDMSEGGSSGWAYQLQSRSMVSINVDSLIATSVLSGRSVHLDGGGVPLSPVKIGDNFFGSGIYQSGRLAVYAAGDGSFQRMVGPAPPGPSATPPAVRHQAYQSWASTNASRQKLALAFRATDRLEIYDGEQLEHLVRGPDFFEPIYEVAMVGDPPTPSMAQPLDMRFGFMDIATTDRFIFALYSGRTFSEVPGYANYGQQVIVFTWTGQPVAVLDFDGESYAIEVSPEENELFAAFDTPTTIIVRYALPSDLGVSAKAKGA